MSSHILTLLSLFPGLLEAGLDEAACIVPADTPDPSPLPDNTSVASVTSQQTNNSYIPSSESINNLSSKVKTKLIGALGYIAGSSSSNGDNGGNF